MRTKINTTKLLFLIFTQIFSFSVFAATVTYDFTNAADYDLSGDASIDGDVFSLDPVAITEFPSTLFDDTTDFGSVGTHDTTQDSGGVLTIDGSGTPGGGVALPNEGVNSWADMTGNVLLLHMDDDSDTTYVDSSGEDNDFACDTASNCPNLNSAGFVNSAADFLTASDSVRYMTASALFDPADTFFSVELWINPLLNTTADPDQTIIGQDHAGGFDETCDGAWLYLRDVGFDGTPAVCTRMGNSEYCPTTINENEWSHVVLVRGSLTTLQIYVNGTPYDAGADYLAANCPVSNSGDFYIGTDDAATPRPPFRGLIDEVAIYDRRLNELEVLSHYLRSHYDSQVFDTGSSDTEISALTWETTFPVQKQLPDDAETETAYADGNADMTGNILLAHFDDLTTDCNNLGAVDSSGSGYDFACGVGRPDDLANGKFNGAAEFQSSSSDSFVGEDATISLNACNTDFTAEMWVQFNAWPNETYGVTDDAFDEVLFAQGTGDVGVGSGRSWLYIENLDNELCSYIGAEATCSAGIPLTKGLWQHVAVTNDSGTIKIYVNGVEEASGSVTVDCANGPFYVASNKAGGQIFQDGAIDELAVYTRALAVDEILDRYYRGVTRVNLQLRSCNDDSCDGEEFLGPDGDANSYYSELTNNAEALPSVTVNDLSANRYVQYRVILTQEGDDVYSPEISSISLGELVDTYDDTGEAFAELTSGAVDFATLSGFSADEGDNNEGTIHYQLSPDGTTFYYFDGSSWVEATDAAESNAESTVDANIDTFASDVSAGSIYFRAYLVSDGTQEVELESVTFTYTSPVAGDDDDDDTSACGDGTIDADEECDDGNTEADDGCSATCEDETVAGDDDDDDDDATDSSGGGGGCNLNATSSNPVAASAIVAMILSVVLAVRHVGRVSNPLA